MTAPAILPPELRRRYEALAPLPEFPGDRSWVDRIDTFENFLEYGPMVADHMRAAGFNERTPDTDSVVRSCPALFRLLLEAFPGKADAPHRRPAVAVDELRTRYAALGPLPQFPGDRSWVDRLDTFENFLEHGPDVACHFAEVRCDWPDTSDAKMGRDCPALYALLLDAFPVAPDAVPRRRR